MSFFEISVMPKKSSAEIFDGRMIFLLAALFFLFFFAHPARGLSEEAAFRHNEKGIEYLENGDFRSAVAELRSALGYQPGNERIRENLAIAYNNHGFDLMQSGRLDLAIDKFERSYQLFPYNPYTVYNLGRAYYQLQRVDLAERYLIEAYELSEDIPGLKNLLDRVRSERAVEEEFNTYQTAHFIVAFSDELDMTKLSRVRSYLAQAYDQVGMLLDHYPENKVVVLLYTEQEYRDVLGRQPHWALALFDGKLRIPAGRFAGEDTISLKEIIYHEYAHAVVYDIVGDRCPRWLNEGIASKAETLVERKDIQIVEDYLEKYGLIPFARLPDDFSVIDSAELMTFAYINSYLAVAFILDRYGRGALRDILEYLGRGLGVHQALHLVAGEDPEEIEKRWESFVSSRYARGDLQLLR